MASEKHETSVPLYPVSSPGDTTTHSYNSNRPSSPMGEFSFHSQSPDTTQDFAGSIDGGGKNSSVNINSSSMEFGSETNGYNLSKLFNRKRFEWLLEVDDTGDDDDMDKPLL